MKKILAILIMTAGMLSFTNESKAQYGEAALFPLIAGDSISTSSSLDTVSKVFRTTAGYSAIGVQVNGTRISGTVTVKAYLYGSMDGTNYVVTDSSAAFDNSGTSARFFTKVTSPYTYQKIQVRGPDGAASTQLIRMRFYYTIRKHD